jgi:EAL domain-containing protein (putative c-di-GMP-specific phosphodiesterase class I)
MDANLPIDTGSMPSKLRVAVSKKGNCVIPGYILHYSVHIAFKIAGVGGNRGLSGFELLLRWSHCHPGLVIMTKFLAFARGR